jgi:orotate phosphoribosyltransferase
MMSGLRQLTEAEIKEMFSRSGAYLTGHFVLSSGRHSDTYIEKFTVLQQPAFTTRMCEELARRFEADKIETVVGPLTGGMLLAYEVARYLGTRFIFTEREGDRMTLRRGFTVQPGERILVVEDVVTTGGSVHEVLQALRERETEVVGVGALVDRSAGKTDFGCRFEPLWTVDIASFTPDGCPLCRDGVPITKRGSRGLGQGR